MKAAALTGALTLSFYTLFLFLCLLSPAQTRHVVFEEIRSMAGALLYFHVIIPINISGLIQAVQQFCEKITLLQQGYDEKEK